DIDRTWREVNRVGGQGGASRNVEEQARQYIPIDIYIRRRRVRQGDMQVASHDGEDRLRRERAGGAREGLGVGGREQGASEEGRAEGQEALGKTHHKSFLSDEDRASYKQSWQQYSTTGNSYRAF